MSAEAETSNLGSGTAAELKSSSLRVEWDAFNQILSKKIEVMDERIPELQRRIMQEDRRLENNIKELETSWKNERNENDRSENEVEN